MFFFYIIHLKKKPNLIVTHSLLSLPKQQIAYVMYRLRVTISVCYNNNNILVAIA